MNSKRRNVMKFSLACAASLLCVGTASFGGELKFEGEKYAKVRLYRARLRRFA